MVAEPEAILVRHVVVVRAAIEDVIRDQDRIQGLPQNHFFLQRKVSTFSILDRIPAVAPDHVVVEFSEDAVDSIQDRDSVPNELGSRHEDDGIIILGTREIFEVDMSIDSETGQEAVEEDLVADLIVASRAALNDHRTDTYHRNVVMVAGEKKTELENQIWKTWMRF